MRKMIIAVTVLLFAFKFTIAQTYKIDTTEISFENKLRPCFFVKYDANAKTVKKAWASFYKKYYSVKNKGIGFLTNKDLITGKDIVLEPVSDKRMNLYARITDEGNGSELRYFMSFGYDFFIGPKDYPNEFSGMKKILNDFSVEFLTEYYADEAGRLTSKIKDLEKSISNNQHSIKKNIRKAKKSSVEVANGLSAKNTAKEMENEESKRKITDLNGQIEALKIKQQGITRN